jgi:cystathionine gamma-synthase
MVRMTLRSYTTVTRVPFPGVPRHPGFEVGVRQMKDFGGTVSFEVASREEAIRIALRTKLFFLAESLGGIESLIEVPAPMTHASVSDLPLAVPEPASGCRWGLSIPTTSSPTSSKALA